MARVSNDHLQACLDDTMDADFRDTLLELRDARAEAERLKSGAIGTPCRLCGEPLTNPPEWTSDFGLLTWCSACLEWQPREGQLEVARLTALISDAADELAGATGLGEADRLMISAAWKLLDDEGTDEGGG